ncbi:hypothetical protein KSI01_17850 [Kurthia sibirica]|nr:hypothetical protein KSI01_17850 [Kurthia sibirica]
MSLSFNDNISKFSSFVSTVGTSVNLLSLKFNSKSFFKSAKTSGIFEMVLPANDKYSKFVNNSIPYVDR